jgi:hypothetical protein
VGDAMKTIIFSKNRGMQLDALLRSLNLTNVSVLYKCDEHFKAGYGRVLCEHPSILLIKEYSFRSQILAMMTDEYILFLVDDDIMIRLFDEESKEFNEFKENKDILTLSLRMAKHYDYDFLKGKKVKLPEFDGGKWEWKKYKHDWGYPMSASSHIFRREDILPLLTKYHFTCPNTLEHALRKNPPNKPFALCYNKPLFINNLANQVQSGYPCKNLGVPLTDLEYLFKDGYSIDIDKLKKKAEKSKSCFMMEDYKYV